MRFWLTLLLLLAIPLYSIFAAINPTLNTRTPFVNDRLQPAPPYATRRLSLREEGLEIRGELPVVQYSGNLGAVLNRRINETYNQKVAAAKENRARRIDFDWFSFSSEGINSILIRTTITTTVSRDEVNSFNYTLDGSRLVGVNDILGTNGLDIASKVISRRIRSEPGRYHANFPGLRDTDAFYVSGNEITFLFDAFQIAPGSEGIVDFSLRMDNISHSRAMRRNADYWIDNTNYSLKMVSLRAVCDELGYTIAWDPASRAVTVRRGDVTVSLRNGQNVYTISRPGAPNQTRSLEAAPRIRNGVTYVPISFFDQILDLVAFNVQSNGDIIFTTYLGR